MHRSGNFRAMAANRAVLIAVISTLAVALMTLLHAPSGAARAQTTDLAGLVSAVANESAMSAQPSAAASADYFLKIEGIDGESQDDTHKGEIEIQSFSWGATNSGSFAGRGGGGGAGKVSFQDFHFVKTLDKASPKLMLACATGQHIPKVTLVARHGGERPQEYLKITLSDVLITSYQSSGSGGVPTDSFSINFAKIEFEYKPQKADGSLDAPVKAGYDLKANKKV